MIDPKSFPPAAAGFYTPSLVTVFLVVIFIAALFGTRMLNSPERASEPVGVQYSERYLQLNEKESLDAAERAELELETCRFNRDMIYFLKSRPFASYQTELASYAQSCEKILPLE